MTWTFDTMKATLSDMARDNYEDFVKAFLAMELSISNPSLLHQLYQDFMEVDDVSLVHEDLRLRAEQYQESLKSDITDLLEKVYRTGEGSSFIMDVISSNSILKALERYDVEVDEYSSLALETLQDIIQKDLSLTSHDYFGDVTLIAIQKDLLDENSSFLHQYVTGFLDTPLSTKDQRTLVLD
ncbi:TPA: hypothetical protein U2C91_001291 [Streptococcus suis]|nr:hypothetical protein [Streptococcus suis]NQM48068.1 hypothetical protein [Streptococcus suis]HEL1640343.1 hypothetical protein [Streptococcus suis]HEM4070940.1 hypothetical protein [Streptococcus suis]HEM4482634.1 hypothetical protein [Streptococcus suis]